MAKSTILVAICSLAIVVMFGIMVYLMSTVNPPEKFTVSDNKDFEQTKPSTSEPPNESGRRVRIIL